MAPCFSGLFAAVDGGVETMVGGYEMIIDDKLIDLFNRSKKE